MEIEREGRGRREKKKGGKKYKKKTEMVAMAKEGE